MVDHGFIRWGTQRMEVIGDFTAQARPEGQLLHGLQENQRRVDNSFDRIGVVTFITKVDRQGLLAGTSLEESQTGGQLCGQRSGELVPVVFASNWEEYLDNVDALVRRLDDASLVSNLAKC